MILRYGEAFSEKFINDFNSRFNKIIINPDKEFGSYIDVESILKALGYEIETSDYTKSGSLDSKNKVIKINPNEPLERQRFTLAHELGHILQGKISASRNFDSSDYSSSELRYEAVANNFAAQFIMPKNLLNSILNSQIRELDINDNDISQWQFSLLLENVSRILKVSKLALKIRINNLGLFKNV